MVLRAPNKISISKLKAKMLLVKMERARYLQVINVAGLRIKMQLKAKDHNRKVQEIRMRQMMQHPPRPDKLIKAKKIKKSISLRISMTKTTLILPLNSRIISISSTPTRCRTTKRRKRAKAEVRRTVIRNSETRPASSRNRWRRPMHQDRRHRSRRLMQHTIRSKVTIHLSRPVGTSRQLGTARRT